MITRPTLSTKEGAQCTVGRLKTVREMDEDSDCEKVKVETPKPMQIMASKFDKRFNELRQRKPIFYV